MTYHLHHGGKDLGAFPLEELRRLRQGGELTGTEYVWCEGMPNWLPLDLLLEQTLPQPKLPGPPPLPASVVKPGPSNQNIIWWLVGALLLFVVIVTVVGLAGAKLSGRFLPFLNGQIAPVQIDPTTLASKKVVWTTNTLTETDMQKRRREFVGRQWLEGYQRRGLRSEPCDAEALKFITTWLDREYTSEQFTNLPSNQEWANQLANSPGCEDPLLLTLCAVHSIELHESIRRLDRALELFQHSQHLAYPKFYAAVMQAGNLENQPERVATQDAAAVQFFKQMLTDGSLTEADQAQMAQILIPGWGDKFFWRNRTAICQMVEEAAPRFHWLALVVRGQYHIIEAWNARGNGYTDKVSEAGWRGFTTHLSKARTFLTKAWVLKPELVAAPARMIYVALGNAGVADMRVWFDRALQAQLDYNPAWSDMRWGLRPRWYGNPSSMLALGVTAVSTKRFDTDVPRKLIDVVQDLEAEQSVAPGQHLYQRADIWPHVQEMYEGYLAEPSQLRFRDGWRSSYAVIAYLAKHYAVARTQLEALDWQPRKENLRGWDVDLTLMPLEVAARTSSVGAQVADAEDARHHFDLAGALSIYTNLLGTNLLDKRTTEFMRARIAGLRMEEDLQTGEWVNFLPRSDPDPVWAFVNQKSLRLSPGQLEVQSDANGHFIYCRARPGTNVEIQGEFEVVHSTTTAFQAGLTLGFPDLSTGNWYSFRIKRNSVENDVASFGRGWTSQQILQPTHLNDVTNSFSLRFQNGHVTASVNGREVFNAAPAPGSIRVGRNDFVLGLGAFNDSNQTHIRYRHLQVRKVAELKSLDGE